MNNTGIYQELRGFWAYALWNREVRAEREEKSTELVEEKKEKRKKNQPAHHRISFFSFWNSQPQKATPDPRSQNCCECMYWYYIYVQSQRRIKKAEA